MTESLADGSGWHLSDLVLAFHFSPLWTNGTAFRSMNSIDSILEGKELMKMRGFAKTFPGVPCVSLVFGGPSLRSAMRKNVPTSL